MASTLQEVESMNDDVISAYATQAHTWIGDNMTSINECIQQCLDSADRNPVVQSLINVGKERSRVVQGALPYGVGRLKINLMDDLDLTQPQATAAIARLKEDERLYQVGRGLGKLLAVYSGPPKELNVDGTFAAIHNPNPPIPQGHLSTGNFVPTLSDGYIASSNTYITASDGMLFPKVEVAAQPGPGQKTQRLDAWLGAHTIAPRKAVRKVKPSYTPAPKPAELENPPIVEFGDLQEIYDKFSMLFEELKAKCDELKEENMVLNQATWQS